MSDSRSIAGRNTFHFEKNDTSKNKIKIRLRLFQSRRHFSLWGVFEV